LVISIFLFYLIK